MTLKGIIWDFDGVILDSFQDVYQWFGKVCAMFGKPFAYNNIEDFRQDFRDPVCPAMYEFLGFDWGRERDVLWNYYHEHKRQANINLVNGIDSVIKELDASGLKQCIASSNSHENIEKRLDENNLGKYFPIIIAKEDLPLENNEPRYKPNPDCLLICLEKLKLKHRECVYIGDQVSDIMAARNVTAGHLPVIAVSYGFGIWQKLKAANPDYPKESPIGNPEQLLEIIRRL